MGTLFTDSSSQVLLFVNSALCIRFSFQEFQSTKVKQNWRVVLSVILPCSKIVAWTSWYVWILDLINIFSFIYYLLVYLYISLHFFFSTWLLVSLSICLPVYLTTLSVYLFTRLPIYKFVSLQVYQSTCLLFYFSSCLLLYMYICLPIYQ